MAIATTTLAIFAASQIGTPGPANMALLATGARYGFRAALPFMLGVALGKQFVIWPVGFGLMQLAEQAPVVFEVLKWASAAYICWLAWKVANLRLSPGMASDHAPGFRAGLIVHPLNPKAWAMALPATTVYMPERTTLSLLIVAVVFGAIAMPAMGSWTILGQQMARWLTDARRLTLFNYTMAGLLILSLVPVFLPG